MKKKKTKKPLIHSCSPSSKYSPFLFAFILISSIFFLKKEICFFVIVVPVCVQWPEAALRGVAAIQRGRARAAYPAAAAAAAAAFARHPTPLAGALHGYTPVLNTLPVDGSVYYDPFLAAHAADPNYRLQVCLNLIT